MRLHRSWCNAGTVLAKSIQEGSGGYKNVCQFLKRLIENAGNVKPKDLERWEGIWNVVAQASSASVAREAPEATPEVLG